MNSISEKIAHYLRIIHGNVFNETIAVNIVDNVPGEDNPGVACYVPPPKGGKLLGMGGQYIVVEPMTTLLSGELEPVIIGIAAHEVRHRFQDLNPDCILSKDFLVKHKLVQPNLVRKLIEDYNHQELVKLEIDAYFISNLSQTLLTRHGLGAMSSIMALVKCNQQSFEKRFLIQ